VAFGDDAFAVEFDSFDSRVSASAELHHNLSVDANASCLDEFFCCASRGDACVREDFL